MSILFIFDHLFYIPLTLHYLYTLLQKSHKPLTKHPQKPTKPTHDTQKAHMNHTQNPHKIHTKPTQNPHKTHIKLSSSSSSHRRAHCLLKVVRPWSMGVDQKPLAFRNERIMTVCTDYCSLPLLSIDASSHYISIRHLTVEGNTPIKSAPDGRWYEIAPAPP